MTSRPPLPCPADPQDGAPAGPAPQAITSAASTSPTPAPASTPPATPPLAARPRQTGLVLGKFLPPHLGHVYLIDFARHYADELTVVVGTLRAEPIPGALRHAWVQELFPSARVLHLTDENPQDPSEHPDFWRIWRESLLRLVPSPPDLVFASEPYGARLAAELGATFVPVDLPRGAVPISGTAVRADPYTHWDYLPPCVRPHFVRRVCVFGPESTGKTTLARDLAARFQTVMVPEYARSLLSTRPGQPAALAAADIALIARGQIAAEDALARQANRVLISDTDVLATTIWGEALFGECPAWVRDEAARRRPDLYLLTDIDVPWEPDPVRYLPDERASFLARCEAALVGRRTLRLRGPREVRLAMASAAIEDLLRPQPARPPAPRSP